MVSNKEAIKLGELIAKLRKEKGYSQRKFAQISGLSNTTISRIENGETLHPDIDTLRLLAVHLDYPEKKLIRLIDPASVEQQPKKGRLKYLQQPIRYIKRYSTVGYTIQHEINAEMGDDLPLSAEFAEAAPDQSSEDMSIKVPLKGMRLITLRLEKNITQKELSDALGLDKIMISQYEGEILRPELGTVKRLADFFEVSVDYLTGESKPLTEVPVTAVQPSSDSPAMKILSKQVLKPEYMAIAEEIQAAGIEIEDVRAFIAMLRRYKEK